MGQSVDLYRIIKPTQANEFTTVLVNKFIPALPPCTTPSDCTATASSCGRGQCRVAVPYSFDATPWANIPAVTTARHVFWVTNPSLAMYFAMNQQCRGVSAGMLAFEAESSYSSIQVWRMDPYEFCPTDPQTGVRRCPEDTSATFKTLPGFISGTGSMSTVCEQYFLVVAPTLTYVNDYNLALTVLNTTFANVDTRTLRPINESKARSAQKPPRLEIHSDPRSSEGLPRLLLHPEMCDDAFVVDVQQIHPILTTLGVGTQKAHALEKLRLVALVRAGDAQHLFTVLGRNPRDQRIEPILIARHVMGDPLDLIRSQKMRALKLHGERFAGVAGHVAHDGFAHSLCVSFFSFFYSF
jgi:hypothetical protein